jgi:hypothetical protein
VVNNGGAPIRAALLGLFLSALVSALSSAQNHSGELRLTVTDSDGAALASAHGMLVSQAGHFELAFDTDSAGEYVAKELPFGTYHLTLEQSGFAPNNFLVEIHSQLPQKITVALTVARVAETIAVTDSDTLLDVTNPGNVYELGAPALRDWASGIPGRQAIDVVALQPGWAL